MKLGIRCLFSRFIQKGVIATQQIHPEDWWILGDVLTWMLQMKMALSRSASAFLLINAASSTPYHSIYEESTQCDYWDGKNPDNTCSVHEKWLEYTQHTTSANGHCVSTCLPDQLSSSLHSFLFIISARFYTIFNLIVAIVGMSILLLLLLSYGCHCHFIP